METKRQNVYNLIILDESGSMNSILSSTINGFNELVETIRDVESKFPEQKHFVSLITFNSEEIKEVFWNKEVDRLTKLNEETFKPNHNTPLYDAIGKSVSRLKEELNNQEESNVLITIITDGEENCSKTYNAQQIKQMIEDLKMKSWVFAYIGANHDVYSVAEKMSIPTVFRFEANDRGVKKMFDEDREHRVASYSMMSRKLLEQDFSEMEESKED